MMPKAKSMFLFTILLWISPRTTRGFGFQSTTPQQPITRHHGRIFHLQSSTLSDFSNPYFWEEFYKQQLDAIDQASKDNDEKEDDDNSFVFEWHDSIPLEDLADLIPANSNCLMVGCGNSLLPQVVLDRNDGIHTTLLDTSQTCLEQLQVQYQEHLDNVCLVCGSATEMSSQPELVGKFDVIIDKGLTDAFMCGDAWETPMKDLLRESGRAMADQGGFYVLVSYKLSSTVQEILQQLCDEEDEDVVWEWKFDYPSLSNDRVSTSIARVRPKEGEGEGEEQQGEATTAEA